MPPLGLLVSGHGQLWSILQTTQCFGNWIDFNPGD